MMRWCFRHRYTHMHFHFILVYIAYKHRFFFSRKTWYVLLNCGWGWRRQKFRKKNGKEVQQFRQMDTLRSYMKGIDSTHMYQLRLSLLYIFTLWKLWLIVFVSFSNGRTTNKWPDGWSAFCWRKVWCTNHMWRKLRMRWREKSSRKHLLHHIGRLAYII